jgi:hypothetical protein
MDILLEKDFIRSLVESRAAFREFVAENWERAYQAVFVWRLQLPNLEISPFVLYVTCRANGMGKPKSKISKSRPP